MRRRERGDKRIQDYDPLYAFLRYYVDLALRLSYRTVRYVGREKIPQDGAVIYAPNHTNGLMDAMVRRINYCSILRNLLTSYISHCAVR